MRFAPVAASWVAVLGACVHPEAAAGRPNFLVIVADDLGYTDLGLFGSEIETPNLDRLARSGLLLTNFLVSPTCSPTRAMLLTGLDTHPAGLGTMAGDADERQKGKPGYEGFLRGDARTVAEMLRAAGYLTCMAGKWHLGMRPEQGPHARGFERSFALLPGGASHFSDAFRLVESDEPAPYREDGEPVRVPDGFFSSDHYTDKLIEYVREADAQRRPFFAYAAYTAPHWPLHAPNGWINRYRGVYDGGYDVLRERRRANAIAHGLVARGQPAPPRYRFAKPWNDLTPGEQRRESRTMEIYAAMVANLDHNIGRLLDALLASGRLENTVVVFFPDNGPEGNPIGNLAGIGEWVPRRFDNRLVNLGRRDSYCWLSPGWARATVAPWRLFKAFPTQGGVRMPAIVSWPGRIAPRRSDAIMTVRDVAPTLIGLATGEPCRRSLVDPPRHGELVFGWELFGRRALQKGRWKIVWLWQPYGPERWELYDLTEDPGETRDLSARHPDKLRELLRHWDEYVDRNGVVLPSRDTGYALER